MRLLLGSPSSWYCWLVSLNYASNITLILWGFFKNLQNFCFWNVFMLDPSSFFMFLQLNRFFFCTTEDDTSIPTDEKVPILIAFHRHIYNTDWHYSCKSEESLDIFDLSHANDIWHLLTYKFYSFNFRWYEGVQGSNGSISPCCCCFFGTWKRVSSNICYMHFSSIL